ncbi:MAG: serine hydrolase domain-containing protein, partial [Terriglobales bacterium]
MTSRIHLTPAYDEQDHQFARAFTLLAAAAENRAFPGASLAIAHRGSLVAYKAVGRFTYDSTALLVVPETIYDLASLTKPIATTTAAMLLFERGLLDLEMPLELVVPEFQQMVRDDRRRSQITLKMLLAHSSGLPAYARLFENANTRDAMIRAACGLPLEADPGTRTEYSDIGFILLGVAIERIADEPLDR